MVVWLAKRSKLQARVYTRALEQQSLPARPHLYMTSGTPLTVQAPRHDCSHTHLHMLLVANCLADTLAFARLPLHSRPHPCPCASNLQPLCPEPYVPGVVPGQHAPPPQQSLYGASWPTSTAGSFVAAGACGAPPAHGLALGPPPWQQAGQAQCAAPPAQGLPPQPAPWQLAAGHAAPPAQGLPQPAAGRANPFATQTCTCVPLDQAV